jgi:hypothetical protein
VNEKVWCRLFCLRATGLIGLPFEETYAMAEQAYEHTGVLRPGDAAMVFFMLSREIAHNAIATAKALPEREAKPAR